MQPIASQPRELEVNLPHTVLTWFSTLQSGWVRSPGHIGTHCTHLCPWNQPWAAAVGYGGPFCCTLEVINGSSAWRSGLHTANCSIVQNSTVSRLIHLFVMMYVHMAKIHIKHMIKLPRYKTWLTVYFTSNGK